MEFIRVGETNHIFIKALGGFQGILFVGTYNDREPSAIYKYPPVFEADDYMGLYDTGESIYKFAELKDRFYAATESKGWIMRLNSAKTDWDIIYDGGRFNLILNIYPFKGYIYAYAIDYRQPHPDLYDGKIVRSSNGTDWYDVWIAGEKFLHSFVEYEDELYIFGGHKNGTAWAKKSANGTNWENVSLLSNRLNGIWDCAIVEDGKIWVVRRAGRDRKLYSYNKSLPVEVFNLSNAPPRTEITRFDNAFWLLLGPNGKSDPDDGLLYTSVTGEAGSWQLVKNFGCRSGRCMYVFENDLYLGIQKILYKMISSSPPPPPEKWPIYQAEGYGELFMYEENKRLKWFPNYTTLKTLGYVGVKRTTVPISWFYDKPIVESIKDEITGKIYPAEETPNYKAYRESLAPIEEIKKGVIKLDTTIKKARTEVNTIKRLLGI